MLTSELIRHQESLDSCLYCGTFALLSAQLSHVLLTTIQPHRLHTIPAQPTLELLAFKYPSNRWLGQITLQEVNQIGCLQIVILLRILGYTAHQVRLKYTHFSETHQVMPLIVYFYSVCISYSNFKLLFQLDISMFLHCFQRTTTKCNVYVV